MPAIKEYRVTALVRHNDREGPEGVMAATVEARNVTYVKRLLLELIWERDMLLSRWLTIKERKG